MKTYLFTTTTILNDSKFWIESGIIRPIYIKANDLDEALLKYREYTDNSAYVSISDNALKNKSEQFCDLPNGGSVQTGFVIKGRTEIDNVQKYVELWITIEQIINPFA